MSWEDIFDTTAEAEQKQATYETITEGEYLGFIDGAKIIENRTPVQTTITWKIVSEGPSKFANRLVFANYTMNEKGIPFLKSDLRKLGFNNVTKANLRDTLSKLIGHEAKIYIKPKPTTVNGKEKVYYSVWINEALTSTHPVAPGFDHTENIPF